MKKIITSLILFSPILVLARDIPEPGGTILGQDGVDGVTGIENLINSVGNWMFTILMALAVVFVLFAAFYYMTAAGGERVNKAHKILIWALVAVAVAILAKGITFLVEELVLVDAGSGATSSSRTPSTPAPPTRNQ